MKQIIWQVAAIVPVLLLHGITGFIALMGYLVVTAGVSASNTAKVRATEARVNGVVTQLGTTNTNVATAMTTANNALPKSGGTVSGNLEVTGSLTVDTNLGVHGGTTLVGSSSCSNDFTVGTSLTVDGNLGVHGGTTMIGNSSCSGTFAIDGGGAMPNGSLSAASAPPTGGSAGSTIAGSQFCGSFFTGSGAATWAQGISNKVDAIISALQVNNIIN